MGGDYVELVCSRLAEYCVRSGIKLSKSKNVLVIPTNRTHTSE